MSEEYSKEYYDIFSSLEKLCKQEGLQSIAVENFKDVPWIVSMVQMLYFLEKFSYIHYYRIACTMIASCFGTTVESMPAVLKEPKPTRARVYPFKKKGGKS